MTVRKGERWGTQGPLGPEGVMIHDDRAARAVVVTARRRDRTPPELGLLGGDLAHTVGATGDADRLRTDAASRLPIDLGSVLIDGRLEWFVAHLVVRRRWWQGPFLVAMNAEYLGPWKVAPRAHPGDGLLDVLDGSLGLDDRLRARSRLGTGDHLPHPDIRVRRVAAVQYDVPRGAAVWLDGERIGPASTLSIRVEPDALVGVV